MTNDDARRVLKRSGVLRQRADLDLLIFFVRHPRALLTSEQLAGFLGYDQSQIAASLEILLAAKLLTRTQGRSHAARLYVFTPQGHSGGSGLPELLQFVATREGRLALRDGLPLNAQGAADPMSLRDSTQRQLPPSRPFLVPRKPRAVAAKRAIRHE